MEERRSRCRSVEPLDPDETRKAIETLSSDFTVTQFEKNTLSVQWKDAKLSFFGEIRFPLIKKPMKCDHLSLLSIPDIAAMKIGAMLRRSVLRDYFDIAYLLQFEDVKMKDFMNWFEKKYEDQARQFPPELIFKTLTYLEDVPEQKLEIVNHRNFFQKGPVKKIIQEIIAKKAKEYLENP